MRASTAGPVAKFKRAKPIPLDPKPRTRAELDAAPAERHRRIVAEVHPATVEPRQVRRVGDDVTDIG